jgi:hypothetical protein
LKAELPFLEKGLCNNSELKQTIYDNYKIEYLKILDRLFEELYSCACKGIEVKVNETSAELFRFQSLVSELEFARYFARNKMQVELLSNNAFQGRKAPDMWVEYDSKEYFVEVKSIQLDEEDYNFGTKIAETLNSFGKSFMVVVKSSSLLSTPSYKYKARDKKETDCQIALNEFKGKLKNIAISTAPMVITTMVADIELHPTKKAKSYLGISTMEQAIAEPPEYKERIKYDILQKSKKREDWTGNELDKFYIVAIDDNSLFFYIDRYNVELFGNATYYCYPLTVPEARIDSEIENAIKKGWEDYLKKMCVLCNNRSLIPENERGMFFTEPSMRNATAVLVRHRDGFYLLANPLAEGRINNHDVLAELKGCLVGWE